MSDSKPADQREVVTTLLSRSGWVRGTLHVPADATLSEFLESGHEFLPLTKVRIESTEDELPFFALHRSAVLFVMADPDEASKSHKESPAVKEDHELVFLLDVGTIRGKLGVPPQLRLSDFLANPRHYLLVRDVRLKVRDPWTQVVTAHMQPFVFLSVDAIVGISEPMERRIARLPTYAPPSYPPSARTPSTTR
ncbi:MAG: hypothetical protein HY791_22060 [Deltaproteobacteria bacterium]|nr:hypothetical protein [Deltaproteobacteria bacterium]